MPEYVHSSRTVRQDGVKFGESVTFDYPDPPTKQDTSRCCSGYTIDLFMSSIQYPLHRKKKRPKRSPTQNREAEGSVSKGSTG